MNELSFRVHAVQRMFERNINEDQVRQALDKGKVIKEYPDDKPYPSRLVLGFIADRPIHIVTADDPMTGLSIVITVYVPDPNLWEPGFERKKSQ